MDELSDISTQRECSFLEGFFQRKSHPAVQFVKYSICGALATLVFIVASYFFSWLVLPALRADDPILKILPLKVQPVEESLRATRFVVNSIFAFIIANFVAYITNILWVFEPGRHNKLVEISLFYAVSGFSFGVGTALGWAVIHFFGLSTTTATVSDVVASALINFVMRKFVIFKG